MVVVVMPRPQTLHHLRDKLTNHYRIASIFYMYIDIGKRIVLGSKMGPIRLSMGHPGPPE